VQLEKSFESVQTFVTLLAEKMNASTQIDWQPVAEYYVAHNLVEELPKIEEFITYLKTESRQTQTDVQRQIVQDRVQYKIIEDKSSGVQQKVYYSDNKTTQTIKTDQDAVRVVRQFVREVEPIVKEKITTKVRKSPIIIRLIPNQDQRRALELLQHFIRKLKDIIKNWRPVNKIITKEVTHLPGTYVTKPVSEPTIKRKLKRRITYSYLDAYNPKTTVYTNTEYKLKGGEYVQTKTDLMNLYEKDANGYTLLDDSTPYRNNIYPYTKAYNDYSSITNTGVAGNNFVQIYPLLSNYTQVTTSKGNTDYGSTKFYIFILVILIYLLLLLLFFS
jgi:hypothetical protein